MKYMAKQYPKEKNRFPVMQTLQCLLLSVCVASASSVLAQDPASQQTMSPEQFQQWLQNNNVPTTDAAATAGTTTVQTVQQNQPGQAAQTVVSTTASTPGGVTTTTTATGPVTRPGPQLVTPGMFTNPPGTTTTTTQTTVTKTKKLLAFERGQKAMLNSVPDMGPPADSDAEYAFRALLQQNMPLSPRQVVQLHQQIDIAQRAAATPANIPPKPVSTTLMVNLAPGSTPPAIRLAQNYVSSLVFVDSTGAPWPIASFDIGNPKALNIQWDGKSNILLMQAVSPYSDGNMVIRLVGLQTPITFELVTGQRVVDYRVDIHVSGLGPNTRDMPTGVPLPPGANQLLLGVLDGVAPDGSRTLNVVGADAQAWLLGDKMYLRTRLTLLSPGWVGKMVSPDGMIAYELPRTSSVLVSRYGEPAQLKIEGF